MQKYAIIIGENNEEVSREVQEKLISVGINHVYGNKPGYFSTQVLVIRDGAFWWEFKGEMILRDRDYKIIWPAYVLKHAHNLDGAKKPCEIPPKGYRLVTEEELRKPYPEDVTVKFTMEDFWRESFDSRGWEAGFGLTSVSAFAVPEGYQFNKSVKKLTVAQVCEQLGYDVEIVK